MNTTVYVVTCGAYSDYMINAVFLNKEKAEQYVAAHNSNKDYWSDARIEEYEPDVETEGIDRGLVKVSVLMLRDGSLFRESKIELTGKVTPSEHYLWNQPGITPSRLHYSGWFTDEKHAIKAANEVRAQLIASNQWQAED